MKTGSSVQARFEYAQIFDIRVAGPIDSRMTISSLSQLSIELPIGVRYKGQLVWIDDASKFYIFKNGTTNNDFIQFALESSTALNKYVWETLNQTISGDVFTHNLNNEDLTIQFVLNKKPVTIDYEYLQFNPAQPTEHLNKIRFLHPVGMSIPAGLKIIISH